MLPKNTDEDREKTEQQAPPEQLEAVNRLYSVGLPVALSVFIGIALLLTAVSIGLYLSSNLSRIDLSKPKYADIRPDVLTGKEDDPAFTLDTTSPITRESAQDALNEMKKRREELRKLGGFDTGILSDEQLGISVN